MMRVRRFGLLICALALGFLLGCGGDAEAEESAVSGAEESSVSSTLGESSQSAASPSSSGSLTISSSRSSGSSASSRSSSASSASSASSSQSSAASSQSSRSSGSSGTSQSASSAPSSSQPASSSASSEVSSSAAVSLSSSTLSRAEEAIFSLINEYRAENGLAGYSASEKLQRAARIRADEIAVYDAYSHTRPNGTDALTVLSVEVPVSYLSAGENLMMASYPGSLSSYLDNQSQYSTASGIMSSWKGSSSHNDLLLKQECTHGGVGVMALERNGQLYIVACLLAAQFS